MNFEISKDMTVTAVKAKVKATLFEEFTAFLIEKYGAENVAMVRTGGNSGAKNTLGVKVGVVTEEGCEFDLCATIEPTCREWQERVSAKTGKIWREAFDFEEALHDYQEWEADKAVKEIEKAEKKKK